MENVLSQKNYPEVSLSSNTFFRFFFFFKWILDRCRDRNSDLLNTLYCLKSAGKVNLKWQSKEARD